MINETIGQALKNTDGPPALFVALEAVNRDPVLQSGNRGARKILVTEVFSATEEKALQDVWESTTATGKCSVVETNDTEIAVFNQNASQDKHYHKIGTEIYMVLEGRMIIDVAGKLYSLLPGDMIVVNPMSVHEVKPEGDKVPLPRDDKQLRRSS
jgi:mannose-6-phosphate isomerase-like protein (cupin superfamily)